MIAAVMQPYFFPYIGYWQLIGAVDIFVVFDDVNYINRGWINRNRILISGEPRYFNLPIQKASQNKLISDIYVDPDPKAVSKLLKTVEMAYHKAPYFAEAFAVFESVMRRCVDGRSLAGFLYESIEIVCDHIGIQTRLMMSSDIPKDPSLRGEQKILSICRSLGADKYYNAIGGVSLYDREHFSREGVELGFLEPGISEYGQFGYEFVPYLSILDVMMFCSREFIKDMSKSFRIV